MSDSKNHLKYDIEYLRLRVLMDEDVGLAEWEGAISAYRDSYLLEDSRLLLAEAQSWPLSAIELKRPSPRMTWSRSLMPCMSPRSEAAE